MGYDVFYLYVVQPRNLFIFGLNRAKRRLLERCRAVVVVVAPARVRR